MEGDDIEGETREMNAEIKVKGVPFRSTTRIFKVMTYKKDG